MAFLKRPGLLRFKGNAAVVAVAPYWVVQRVMPARAKASIRIPHCRYTVADQLVALLDLPQILNCGGWGGILSSRCPPALNRWLKAGYAGSLELLSSLNW